jgi:hypothetical protein
MTSTSRPIYFPFALEANGSPSGSLTGAQRHDRAGLATLEHSHHAGPRNAGLHFKAKLLQVISNKARSAALLFAKLRIFVDVAAPCNQLALDLGGPLPDVLFKIGCRLRVWGRRPQWRCKKGE